MLKTTKNKYIVAMGVFVLPSMLYAKAPVYQP